MLPSDALSEVLQDLRLSRCVLRPLRAAPALGNHFPPQGPARFHFVAAGGCWLHSPELGWTPLQAGDVALLPRGTGHALADPPRGKTKPSTSFPSRRSATTTYRLAGGGEGARALLFCGSVSFDEPAVHPLLQLMPPALIVRGAASGDATLPLLLETMADEVVAQRVGAATVLTRLAEAVIARVVRAWVEARTRGRERMARGDPRSEDRPRAGGDSSAPGSSVVGRGACGRREHLAFGVLRAVRVRRRRAGRALPRALAHAPRQRVVAKRPLRVAQVAARLGYESEASFSRAFKRLMGVPPSALRRGERSNRLAVPKRERVTS